MAQRTTPSPPPKVDLEFIGLSVIDGSGRDSTRLRVDRAEYRARRGAAGLITYHDLTELEFTGAKLVLDSASPLEFSEYVDRLYRIVGSFGDSDRTRAASSSGRASLSRVLIADLSITQVSDATTIVLSAGRARLSLDPRTLILEGGVAISNGSGQSFKAPHAVLASDYNAMFALGGNWLDGPSLGRSVYLVVDGVGRLSTTAGSYEPTYADAVDRRERMLLEHFVGRAPASLKPLLYAILQGGSSRRH